MLGSVDSRFCVCKLENRDPAEEALERRRSRTEGKIEDSLPPAALSFLLPLLAPPLPVEREVEVLEVCRSLYQLCL